MTGHVGISPTNYSAILQGLEGVVSNPNGTAYGAFQGFPRRGTWPARPARPRTKQGQEPNSWFVAFGPNPNPQYLVLAVIDQGGYGAAGRRPAGAQHLQLPRGQPARSARR